LEPIARLQLALELGEHDAKAFAESKGISVIEAKEQLALAKSLGRIASIANERGTR
jgi:hypothetical protein